MAEAALDAGRAPPDHRLVVLADVFESMVLQERRSRFHPLLSIEAGRVRRDEARCLAAASRVACFSETERNRLSSTARRASARLDLILPPVDAPAPLHDPLALFIGDRTWAPNRDALDRMARLWPAILQRVPAARLVIVGAAGRSEAAPNLPNVTRLGFVEDLEATWRAAGILVAPVRIGGGVRVKVLDAARHGIPVIGSTAAIGSTDRYLPLAGVETDAEFVERASELLVDTKKRRAEGLALFEAITQLHDEGFVPRQMEDLLAHTGGGRPAAPQAVRYSPPDGGRAPEPRGGGDGR